MSEVHVHMDSEVPHLAWITLDRPEARNAYSIQMLEELCTAFDTLESDDDVWCVALTGAGRTFSAGGDLTAMRDRSGMFAGDPTRLRTKYLSGIHQIPRRISRFDKPLIAAMNGAAIGAGLDLACMCDMRIAVEGAKLGSTFVKLGLIPGDGGTYFLARTVGFPKALELVLTGEILTAESAHAIGLVHRVVPVDGLTQAVQSLAERLTANAPLALRLAKRAAYHSWDLPMHAALDVAASYQAIVQLTDDHLEGVEALLGRRSPTYSGR